MLPTAATPWPSQRPDDNDDRARDLDEEAHVRVQQASSTHVGGSASRGRRQLCRRTPPFG